MLFNSIDFAVFLPIVFILYWCVFNKSKQQQNFLLLVASYTFYGWWNWNFLILILISTLVDYIVGLNLSKEESLNKRKLLLFVSLFVNLGLLGIFKYYNFFIDNCASVFSFLGQDIRLNTLNIILPIGISFYTFQTLSYSIDVYKRKLNPSRNFIEFAIFVGFFPQLVAGPIERASNLLPQFHNKRKFNYHKSVDGMRQILWGLFKKIVIADNCALYANMIFDNYSTYPSSGLILGAIFFAFQIYGDFSGYSDIAIGTARMFGIDLIRNFAYPYFSRDIGEYWRRWHISLSSWFRDYLYIPLGGSRSGIYKSIRNTLVLFLLSGLWHGANWTFVIWGGLNALYIMPSIIMKTNRKNIDIVAKGRKLPSIREFIDMVFTFSLTVFAWIFFRAESVSHAFSYIKGIFSWSIFEIPKLPKRGLLTIVIVMAFVIVEWIGREEEYAIEKIGLRWPRPIRWGFYYFIIYTILLLSGQAQEFIYFQF